MSMFYRTTENTAVSFPIWLYLFVIPFILAFWLIIGTIWLLLKLATLLVWAWQKWRNRC